MNINQFFKIFLASMPFLLMCLANKKVNLRRENRGYQFASMIYGLIFTIVALITADDLADKLMEKIKQLSQKLAVLAEQKPDYQEIFLKIKQFIDNLDWEMYMIFIINFLFMLMFIVSKGILLKVFKSIWKNETLFTNTSGICYEWSEARKIYVLKQKCFSLRIMMNVYYYVAIAIATSLLIACKMHPKWEGFLAVFYPFALVIFLGEIAFFLGGKTEADFADDIGGEGGSSVRVVNYYRLRKYLTMVFGDRVIDQDTELPKYFSPHNNTEIVKKYENIDIQESKVAALYFKRLQKSGVQLDEELVDATYRLMNKESVLFANPFYKDYSNYIFLPLNRAATKGDKILFILGRNGIQDDVIDWINYSFTHILCVEHMWEVGRLNSDEAFNGEVGVVASPDIFNSDIVTVNLPFLKEVSEVVLIEPSIHVITSQLSLALYISKVRDDATFYVIDKNEDGLVDTISHITRKSIKEVSATNRERNRFSYMLWKADGQQLNHRLFPNVARYLGVGTELMIAGIRNQINFTEWYSYSKFPVIDMKWISEQYYLPLCKYASLTQKQEELEKRMKFDNNIWSVEKAKNKYVVVEDEFCNMFEMARQFSTRGTSESFVNVVSQNYLLRDYMEYNPNLFATDAKAIPAFCPDYARTQRNIVIELLLKLSTTPTKKEEILKILRHIEGLNVDPDCTRFELQCIIYKLVKKYFQNECAKYMVTETTLVDFRNDLYFISNREFVFDATKFLKCAYFVTEDEISDKNYLDSKLFGHVYQSLLPGQYLTINGKYYEVLFIEMEKGVVVKRAADSILSREYYRQLRHYHIDNFEVDEKVGGRKTIGSIIVERGAFDFTVTTSGYLLMQDYGDVKNAVKREISALPQRCYSGKAGLKITLPGTNEKIRETICIILNEIFKTTYPEGSDFICAVTEFTDAENVSKGIFYTVDMQDNKEDCIYILEDSILDLGLVTSVERNLKRFFEIVTDFLKWHKAALQPIPVIKTVPTVELPENKRTNSEDGEGNGGKSKSKKNNNKKKNSLINKFKGIFKKKKKDKENSPADSDENIETAENGENTENGENAENPEPMEKSDSLQEPETTDDLGYEKESQTADSEAESVSANQPDRDNTEESSEENNSDDTETSSEVNEQSKTDETEVDSVE